METDQEVTKREIALAFEKSHARIDIESYEFKQKILEVIKQYKQACKIRCKKISAKNESK